MIRVDLLTAQTETICLKNDDRARLNYKEICWNKWSLDLWENFLKNLQYGAKHGLKFV